MTISYDGTGHLPDELLSLLTESNEKGLDGQAEKLEEQARLLYGAPHVLSTVNSTAALHLAMCALDLKRGDKVICSVNAFVDVPEVVRHFDAEPIFVDCDPFSYNINPERLEEALKANQSKKLRAVIVNHMAGLPAELETIYALAEKYDVEVIEDLTDAPLVPWRGGVLGADERTILAIAGLGSKVNGRFDAGLLLSHNEECYERGMLLRNHGMVREKEKAPYLYDVQCIGCQYRLDEYSAIYASLLLEKLNEENRRRREIAEIYFRELEGLAHLRLPLKHEEHTYFRFIVEIDRNRDAFARKLAEKGIEIALHYVPLHTTRYYKEKYELKLFDFPWAMGIYQRAMSLPNRPDLTDEEVLYICDAIREIDAEHI
ncbi:DegT/DnrJ/EryC1/StrS family aminotransferase [Nitratifractor salsuginis]|uniref:DegT/DnrJ/EryC1/StrS aminotransferase n=1 Tax=Nitratifractor salsuginis (strain DSM 16511 / JCM 12458 / E9I37-1) TaxID=749222 RepID=E6X076_NITSE|nr:aminotransferase class I/II-fold pyridoxal phosphate-dependent enzyme [Nitratifractor salsuginis]ADV45665.1 DegT/DnrJ/EryC1/StrS aminotransferase [Nitratifractor salsuginis DSM 16511]